MSKETTHANIELKKESHRRAKVIAILKGITLNEYLEEAIEKAIEDDEKVLKKLK